MPETLFGKAGVFRGKSFNLHADLRTAVINYLDDKVPVSMMKQGPSIATTNMVQTMSTADQEEQGEDEVTQDEIFAMVQQYRKGKCKGKKRACWNCGGSDTTAEIARMTNKTTAGQMAGMEDSERKQGRQRCRQRMGRREGQLEQLEQQ